MKSAYVDREGMVGLPTVQRSDLATRLGDALPKLGRLEHLDVGAEAEQLAVGLAQVLEDDDHPPVLLQPGLARQVAAHLFGDSHPDLDARATLLEGARPFVPERRELELGRTLERV